MSVIGTTPGTPPIATENAVVRDPYLGIDRHVFAGQPVPADLVVAYEGRGAKPTTVAGGQVAGRTGADVGATVAVESGAADVAPATSEPQAKAPAKVVAKPAAKAKAKADASADADPKTDAS